MSQFSLTDCTPQLGYWRYQNADLWGLWGGGANAPRAPPPGYRPATRLIPISQFGVSKNTCARRDKKKHIFFFFCHAKYTHVFALKKFLFLRYAWFYPDARTCFLKLRTSLFNLIWLDGWQPKMIVLSFFTSFGKILLQCVELPHISRGNSFQSHCLGEVEDKWPWWSNKRVLSNYDKAYCCFFCLFFFCIVLF